MEDMRKDGVIYIVTRNSPVLLTQRGLYYEDIIQLGSVRTGAMERRLRGQLRAYPLLELRVLRKSLEVVELPVNYRNQGVVGFDLAGEEGGFPRKNI